jgi:hypothetical protein
MSVCIAALADRDRAIVVCFDRNATLVEGAFSAEDVFTKMVPLIGSQWSALFAGNDVTPVEPIIRRARKALRDAHEGPYDIDEVVKSMCDSYLSERSNRAAIFHLGIYQLTMAEFLSNGETLFGETGYGIMRERIERTELECEFLCVGFGPKGTPYLFKLSNPGLIEPLDRLGFWAIGSGAYSAIARMAARQQHAHRTIESTVYNVCEAKISAEGAEGVGKQTILMVLRPDGSYSFVEHEVLASLRPRIEAALRPRIGDDVLHRLRKEIESNWRGQESDESAEEAG